MGITRRCPECETGIKAPERTPWRRDYCSGLCRRTAKKRRQRRRWALNGRCRECGRPAFPYVNCEPCRAVVRARSQALRTVAGKKRYRPGPARRPVIGGRAMSERIVDAFERFDSLAETVWMADPASFYTNEQCDGPLSKRQSPRRGTQRLKEEERQRPRDRR